MKRYLVFLGDEFTVGGGATQLRNCFDTLREAQEYVELSVGPQTRPSKQWFDWGQILDTETQSCSQYVQLGVGQYGWTAETAIIILDL